MLIVVDRAGKYVIRHTLYILIEFDGGHKFENLHNLRIRICVVRVHIIETPNIPGRIRPAVCDRIVYEHIVFSLLSL